jgi:hypothetical protein
MSVLNGTTLISDLFAPPPQKHNNHNNNHNNNINKKNNNKEGFETTNSNIINTLNTVQQINPLIPIPNTSGTPDLSNYMQFFKSLVYLFFQVLIAGYIGSCFLTLGKMDDSLFPRNIWNKPYCSTNPESDPVDFPYNLFENGDCKKIKAFDDTDGQCKSRAPCDVSGGGGLQIGGGGAAVQSEYVEDDDIAVITPPGYWIRNTNVLCYSNLFRFFSMTSYYIKQCMVYNDPSNNLVENSIMVLGVLFIIGVLCFVGFYGFFGSFIFGIYNNGFVVSGFIYTIYCFFVSWIPPSVNFFCTIFTSIKTLLFIPYTIQSKKAAANEKKSVVIETMKEKKSVLMMLFSVGMLINAFIYLTSYEPFYVLFAIMFYYMTVYKEHIPLFRPATATAQ